MSGKARRGAFGKLAVEQHKAERAQAKARRRRRKGDQSGRWVPSSKVMP